MSICLTFIRLHWRIYIKIGRFVFDELIYNPTFAKILFKMKLNKYSGSERLPDWFPTPPVNKPLFRICIPAIEEPLRDFVKAIKNPLPKQGAWVVRFIRGVEG